MLNLPKPWRLPLLALALSWALLVALYYDTGAGMVVIWERNDSFAHAWVVPPIAAWLVWRKRADLAVLVPRPALRWLWPLVPVGLLWAVGELASGNAPTQFALVGMMVLMVPTLLGTEVARRIAFPLGFLFFAVPFGDFLTPWLIDRTADFTVVALRATGIPVYREGTQFVIPSGSWSVVHACSGIRYLTASLMVGALFAYLNYRSHLRRWIFVGVSIVTPLVANWLRAYLIVMLGHLSGNELAVGVDHIIYGWVFFGLIMLVMFTAGSRWAEADPEPEGAPPGMAGTGSSAARIAAACVAAMLIAAAPAGLSVHAASLSAHGRPQLEPPRLAGWTWRDEPLSTWRPAFHNAAASVLGRYESAAGETIGVYIGYYRDQRYGRQLVTSTNELIRGDDWARTSQNRVALDGHEWLSSGLRGQALATVSGAGEEALRLRVWQVYWINGRLYTSDWQAKLAGVLQALAGRGDDAAIIVVYANGTAAGPDDRLLRDFLSANWPTLDTHLRATRDRDLGRKQ